MNSPTQDSIRNALIRAHLEAQRERFEPQEPVNLDDFEEFEQATRPGELDE